MASSTTGERRWASSKRGGMTVLGKVAVPKPINLPSQRLENHGLDPNVEIVPKGTLSWGSRPSSSGSNAWGSSTVFSPRTEGGSVSPSHLSGRPSSGGTRPSTAGSETMFDSASNLQTSNSRPSSASGVLASNNTLLTTMQPCSAETRPGSSQLSRFAEPIAEGTGAWGRSGAAEKLGISSSTPDRFALSSGDFPALGSEKDSGKNAESLDTSSHELPCSSSGGPSATSMKLGTALSDEVSQTMDVNNGMDNFWRNDGPECVKDGLQSGLERWHGGPYPYTNHKNPNISPHPHDTWRGPPVNPSGGIWYRGPPGPPYAAPVTPGGFPLEPFPYYHPQVPAPGLAGLQTGPPQDGGAHGQRSKNAELYGPMVEPYMRPGMPIRPGFYPGYYGPPVSFYNLNEQGFPFRGMPTGHPAHNRCPNQNAPELNNSDARSSGRAVKQAENGPTNDSQGQDNLPVKQNSSWDKNQEADQCGPKVVATARGCDKRNASKSSSQENAWGEDHKKGEQMDHEKRPLPRETASSVSSDDKIGSTDPGYVKLRGNVRNAQSVDLNVPSLREHSLIQKIEGLNAKVRDLDGRPHFHREEPYIGVRVVNTKASQPMNEANAGVHFERHQPSGILVPVSRYMGISSGGKGFGAPIGSVTTFSRQSTHNLQHRGDHGGKNGSHRQKADGSQRGSAASESLGVASVVSSESNIAQEQECRPAVSSKEISGSHGEAKNDTTTMFDPCDGQHPKMTEISKQRSIQLQKEEEERVREQRAKAFAKLEELNRCSASQCKEASRQGNTPSDTTGLLKQEESIVEIEPRPSHQSGEARSALAHCFNLSQTSKGSKCKVLFGSIPFETMQNVHVDPVRSENQQLPATDDTHINTVAIHQNVIQVREISRQKRGGYKQKYNVYSGKNLIEKPIIADAKDDNYPISIASKEVDVLEVSSSSGSNIHVEPPISSDSIVHPKRKNNKSGKNKHRVDESSDVSSAAVQKSVTKAMKPETKESKLEMERYVPKAAVKELVQQGNAQQSASPSIEQSIPDGMSTRGKVSSPTTEIIGRPVESRHLDGKPKQMKPSSWRQCASTESGADQGLEDSSSFTLDPTQNSQKSDEPQQYKRSNEQAKGSAARPDAQLVIGHSLNCDGHPLKGQPSCNVDGDNAVDGWNVVDKPISSRPATFPGVKDHGTSGKGKRFPFRGQKGSGNNQHFDNKNQTVGEVEAGLSLTGATQAERPISSKESRVARWLPKVQTHVINQQGNRARAWQTVTNDDDKIFTRAESHSGDMQLPSHGSQDTAKVMARAQPQPQPPSVSECRDVSRRPTMAGQETERGRKAAPYKDVEVESAPRGITDRNNNEQHPFSSGHRRSGNYNGRFHRGHEFYGNQSFTTQDSRQNYTPANRERQSRNSRYESQPVRSYSISKGNNSEGQSENRHVGQRFQDRGQGGLSRHGGGNFYGQQRGYNQINNGHE